MHVCARGADGAAFGFFNSYGSARCVARGGVTPAGGQDSVDYVVHLGDYMYEYKNGVYGWGDSIGRVPQPDRTIFTLYDYRRRLATYRTDADLVAKHQHFAWIPVWDDHAWYAGALRDCADGQTRPTTRTATGRRT